MKTECTNCGQCYEIDNQYAGELIECEKCGEAFTAKPVNPEFKDENQEVQPSQKAIEMPGQSVKPDVQRCRYCNAEIPVGVKKCRFCGAWIAANISMIHFFATGLFLISLVLVLLLIFSDAIMFFYTVLEPEHNYIEGVDYNSFITEYRGVSYFIANSVFFLLSFLTILSFLFSVPVIRYAKKESILVFSKCVHVITINLFCITLISCIISGFIIFIRSELTQNYIKHIEARKLLEQRVEAARKISELTGEIEQKRALVERKENALKAKEQIETKFRPINEFMKLQRKARIENLTSEEILRQKQLLKQVFESEETLQILPINEKTGKLESDDAYFMIKELETDLSGKMSQIQEIIDSADNQLNELEIKQRNNETLNVIR